MFAVSNTVSRHPNVVVFSVNELIVGGVVSFVSFLSLISLISLPSCVVSLSFVKFNPTVFSSKFNKLVTSMLKNPVPLAMSVTNWFVATKSVELYACTLTCKCYC